MKVLRYITLLTMVFASGCVTTQYDQASWQIAAPKPSNLVVKGDSAFYAKDSVRFIKANAVQSSDPTPQEFAPVLKQPSIIRNVQPRFPVDASIWLTDGDTKVKIWIDTLGSPVLAIVVSSSDKAFNENSLSAAMQMKFNPCIMKSKDGPVPVAVWLVIPFHFRKSG